VKGPWNLGLKVDNIATELEFLESCGATGIEQGVVSSPSGDERFGMAFLGPQRLLMFEKLIYDEALPVPLPPGLKHAVFQVDDFAATLTAYAARGVTPFFGPQIVTTPHDRRQIAFFRSPSGFIFEVFEILG
jgi:catechol 2,3-dioxygenase-like lactoylglutathione lyase family enzyme